jgi:L-threonylcarbamoyladenylate synthase
MSFKTDLDAALPVLADGGLVLFPADNWWALGCDATNEAAAYRLLTTGIQYAHPHIHLMVQEEADILRFVPLKGIKIFDYLLGVRKPSHAIYENVSGIAPILLLEDNSMAIKTAENSFCKQVLRRLNKPIMTVAAAFPWDKPPAFFSEVPGELVAAADYAVHHRRNLRFVSRESSVVRWHEDGSLSIFLS